MIVKVSAVFLLIIAGLAIYGRLRKTRKAKLGCPRCGRPKIGTSSCPCTPSPGAKR